MTGEPPSYAGGFHARVQEWRVMSVVSSGPCGGPGNPVTVIEKESEVSPELFLIVSLYVPGREWVC